MISSWHEVELCLTIFLVIHLERQFDSRSHLMSTKAVSFLRNQISVCWTSEQIVWFQSAIIIIIFPEDSIISKLSSLGLYSSCRLTLVAIRKFLYSKNEFTSTSNTHEKKLKFHTYW